MKLDFNDLLIVPKTITKINTRNPINPFDSDGFLPLITAPMDTVIDNKNSFVYHTNKIHVCNPRYEYNGLGFNSYSYSDMKILYDEEKINPFGKYLIDVANGHMECIEILTKQFKSKYPHTSLMVGNIANPKTYTLLSEAGADYIRCGIGNGGGCLTTKNTGVGYPMGSLIRECYYESLNLKTPAKIVADGGMQTYSDVIKALALGADYVMLGNILNKSLESAGDNFLFKKIKISQEIAEILYSNGIPIYKKFRGMSTKEVQKKWGSKKLKTSEGVVRFRKVEYRLDKWVENFEDYLRTAMSYSGALTLKEFIGQVDTIQISENSYKRFNK
jgi:IMP dehydrogenase/GMP reductase